MEATELPASTTNVHYEDLARSLPAVGKEPIVLPSENRTVGNFLG